MNTWTETPSGIKPGGRGFYIEGREDHLAPSLLENFGMFSNLAWFEALLLQAGCGCDGAVSALNWSYSYEEPFPGERIRIADIIFMWKDAAGAAVLVIEAKKPRFSGEGVGEKDDPANRYYLQFRALQGIVRLHQALLVDDTDLFRVSSSIKPILTWQVICALQIDAARSLKGSTTALETVVSRLLSHHDILGLSKQDHEKISATGDLSSCVRFASYAVEDRVRAWLIGSEVYFAGQNTGLLTHIPYGWLLSEKSAADYRKGRFQSTAERGRPLWRLDEPGLGVRTL